MRRLGHARAIGSGVLAIALCSASPPAADAENKAQVIAGLWSRFETLCTQVLLDPDRYVSSVSPDHNYGENPVISTPEGAMRIFKQTRFGFDEEIELISRSGFSTTSCTVSFMDDAAMRASDLQMSHAWAQELEAYMTRRVDLDWVGGHAPFVSADDVGGTVYRTPINDQYHYVLLQSLAGSKRMVQVVASFPGVHVTTYEQVQGQS